MEKIKEGLINQRGEMIKEIIQGIEVANKLRDQSLISTTNNQLRVKSSLNNANNNEIMYENQKLLINQMLSSLDNTISIAKLMMVQLHETQVQGTTCLILESPPSQNSHTFSKKRKRNPKEIKKVSVAGSVSGSEGTLGDGYSWRKYGQKIILGAKFPRGYYRCTHRLTQGCRARKQVQRLDEDPTIYEIIYNGDHTCSFGAHMSKAQIKPNTAQIQQESEPEVFLGLGPNGELKVEELDYQNEAHFFRSFSFSSNFVENGPFDNMLSYSSHDFGSPDTTESDYILRSPTGVIGVGRCGLDVMFSDSEVNDAMSGPNSVTNSPKVGEFEFPLDPLLDMDFDFSFEFEL